MLGRATATADGSGETVAERDVPDDIDARLGAVFITTAEVEQFLREVGGFLAFHGT